MTINYLLSTDSTSVYLRNLLKDGDLPDKYCVCADFQTVGRGQMGTVWESNKGENLLFSVYLKTAKIPVNQQFLLSEIVALGIISALKKYLPEIKIKWANDIYFQDKKLCGVLVENVIAGSQMKYSIIGIGLNINQLYFSEKTSNAISLRKILNKKFDLKVILQEVLNEIFTLFDNFLPEKSEDLQRQYFENLYRNSGFFPYSADGENFNAKIVSVDADGRLNLLTDNGIEKSFYFKQVQFLI
ncbi:MAG: biotin--[acetyl-CoA-carboxylase] ligase [Prevotellaceae bacterium]|jgi:BirA family biotin operon repressor/biotin-[acetyl-CoA-carboxylase] ligase|nr:biotin--[acetyl-CoA-carboxylase] ligase [Prevotellaceae bacterium]